MLRNALSQLRAHPSRFAAVCLAIVLGVGFASATQVFTESFGRGLARSVTAETAVADVVVDLNDGDRLDLGAIAGHDGVAAVSAKLLAYSEFSSERGRGWMQVSSIPEAEALRWYTLADGNWPTGSGQVAVDTGTATRNHLTVGSPLRLTDTDGNGHDSTVVGILDTGTSPLVGAGDNAYGTADLLDTLGESMSWRALVLGADGIGAQQLAAGLQDALGAGHQVRTAAEVSEQAVRQLTDGRAVIEVILLCFTTLAALVAAMVVANTFTILITQRRRQIALMRCIGATGSQVRRGQFAEAAVLAVLGTVLGVLAGIGIGRLAVHLAGISGQDFGIPATGLTVVAVLGVVVTLVAALAPIGRAVRIAPLAALRPVDTAEHTRAVSRVRTGLGLLLLLGGGALLALSAYQGQLLPATAGGAITAVGVLLLLRVVLPGLLALFGRAAGIVGAPGRLAVTNLRRNAGRAAATCTALVVGVGAIVTLQVAAASAKAGADASLSQSRPLDLQISAETELPPTLREAVAGIDGVAAVEAVVGTEISYFPEDSELIGQRAYGVTAAQADWVLLAGGLPSGTIAVPDWLGAGMPAGTMFTVGRGSTQLTLTMSDQRITADDSFTLAAEDLARLDPAAKPLALWLRFTEDAAVDTVVAELNELIAQHEGLSLSGTGLERAALADTLDTLIQVALALLAVAVLIAVVGIGNTLGLSVVERTRESALLRALGLRRGQLRLMLGVEAVLLALVAAVVGTVCGTLFGFAATMAAFGEVDQPVVLTVPWDEVALVILGALIAGVLASVLPARRAAAATPTEALAEV